MTWKRPLMPLNQSPCEPLPSAQRSPLAAATASAFGAEVGRDDLGVAARAPRPSRWRRCRCPGRAPAGPVRRASQCGFDQQFGLRARYQHVADALPDEVAEALAAEKIGHRLAVGAAAAARTGCAPRREHGTHADQPGARLCSGRQQQFGIQPSRPVPASGQRPPICHARTPAPPAARRRVPPATARSPCRHRRRGLRRESTTSG